jgi:hypothetical protein
MDNVSSSLGFGASASNPKALVMDQVRQEAAMNNAKQLIEVRLMTAGELPFSAGPFALE